MSVLKKFLDMRQDLTAVLIERESSIDLALIALVTGEHYLQLGPPGVAKSMLVDELCRRITGAKHFSLLLNQSTTPDELFGPVDLLAMADEGRWTRRRGGSITEAHIAFLDEIGRGNSVVRNALLKIILERKLEEIGMEPCTVPLISLFAASNTSMAEDDDLSAFCDRFMLTDIVQDIADDAAFVAMLTAKPYVQSAFVTLEDIEDAHHEVCAVRGSQEVLDKIVELRQTCSDAGIVISPRRWKKALSITKARAWLDGEDIVTPEHLCILTAVLWRDPKERKTVERLVYAAACPIYLTALEAEDHIADLVKALESTAESLYDETVENTLMQISDIHRDLKAKIGKSRVKHLDRATKSLTNIETLHAKISRNVLKRLQRMSLSAK